VDRGRLEAFSDGVFAVAITLLALNLSVYGPGHHEPSLARQLGAQWPAFVSYVISFATIGIIWVNHHALFENFAKIDRALLFLNLLLLFFVVSIPFATSTIAAYLRQGGPEASLAAVIFQGVFAGMSLSFAGLFWWAIRREHMTIVFTPKGARQATIRFSIGNVAYLAAIGIAFFSPVASLVVSGLVAVYYMFEQTPGDATASLVADISPDTGSGDS
jgi:uncharacterized membrane protein